MGIKLTLGDLHQEQKVALRCACSEVIIKSRGTEEVIRAKILVMKSDAVYAVCRKCNGEVELPLQKSHREEAVAPDPGPKLYLDK